MPTTFRSMMLSVDKDIEDISSGDLPRTRIYYSVSLNGRKTEISARSMLMPRNNRPRLSFLINSPADANSGYVNQYLSDTDIINIISDLDSELYDHLTQHLIALYKEGVKINKNSVEFERDTLFQNIGAKKLCADEGVVIIPDYTSNPDILTPFGFNVSFRTFCDDLSLILSTENEDKLKVVIAQYHILSSLLKGNKIALKISKKIKDIKTIQDVESMYERMPFTKRQKFNAEVFGNIEIENYFKRLP